jgi:hypothetical protein
MLEDGIARLNQRPQFLLRTRIIQGNAAAGSAFDLVVPTTGVAPVMLDRIWHVRVVYGAAHPAEQGTSTNPHAFSVKVHSRAADRARRQAQRGGAATNGARDRREPYLTGAAYRED